MHWPKLEWLRAHMADLRYGLLLVPGTIALAIIAVGIALSTGERHAGSRGFAIIFTGGPDSARYLLTTLGEGIATILGISISITIVALQLVSQQFSPRALRNFLADRTTQVMTGTFVGTFGYALVVLRVVRGSRPGQPSFVPTASISLGILLGLASLVVLLAFFHHMVRTVQVEEISADIARETLDVIEQIYPEPFGDRVKDDPDALLDEWHRHGPPQPVRPNRPGYVQRINVEDLLGLLQGRCPRVQIRVAPGDFVTPADPIADIWPANEPESVQRALRAAIVVASSRNVDQDALYGVRQLADIAVKAISPAMNDPSTAWTAIHYIKAIVERIAGRALPEEVRREAAGDREVIVIARRPPFADYVDIGFVQISRYTAHDARVAGALLESLTDIAQAAVAAGAHDRIGPLLEAAEMVARPAFDAAATAHDRRVIEHLSERVRRVARGRGDAAA